MNLIKLLPVIVSVLLLAAHFLRDGRILFVVILLSLLALFFVRHPWVSRIFQIGLILGGLEWLRTLLNLVVQRQLSGQSWTRVAFILGAVILFTAGSAFIFETASLRQRYRLNSKTE